MILDEQRTNTHAPRERERERERNMPSSKFPLDSKCILAVCVPLSTSNTGKDSARVRAPHAPLSWIYYAWA